MPLFKSSSVPLSHNAAKNYYFSRRIDRSGSSKREDKSGPPNQAERSEVVHQWARSDLSFHRLAGSFSRKLPIVRDERGDGGGACNCDSIPHVCAIEPRIVAIATPIYRGNKQRRFHSFFRASDSRDDRLWLSSPLTMHCHTFSMIQRGKDSVRARPTANWLADPSDRRIIKDVLARIYLSYLVVEIDRYNSVWIELGRGYHRFLARCSTRYTMIR